MIKKTIFLLLFLFTIFSSQAQNVIPCIIKTSLGDIKIELYADKAPITVQNFLRYVDKDLYKNSSFFRTCTPENEAKRDIKIEVIQGGNINKEKIFEPIIIETTAQTKLSHKDGTLSMARAKPNTATSQFFICINDQPELDFGGKRNPDGQGFAAFGQVTKGMDIIRKIQAQKNKKQRLIEPINIHSIERIQFKN
jgi:peptidyl-prolyl cis-trans isomerase A (cyclophilin A)